MQPSVSAASSKPTAVPGKVMGIQRPKQSPASDPNLLCFTFPKYENDPITLIYPSINQIRIAEFGSAPVWRETPSWAFHWYPEAVWNSGRERGLALKGGHQSRPSPLSPPPGSFPEEARGNSSCCPVGDTGRGPPGTAGIFTTPVPTYTHGSLGTGWANSSDHDNRGRRKPE